MTEIAKQDKIQALHQFSKDVMVIWQNTKSIKEVFAPNLTEQEFKFFCGLGISLGANPFKREIWAVKYDKSKPAAVFCGRDFYRRKAQEQSDYDGHIVDVVYSNDKFRVENGMPRHEWALNERGDIVGAYFTGWRKSVDKTFFHFVKFTEYNKGQSSWNNMPETMIKKVVEAQGLRMMFQGIFSGTYDESEIYDEEAEYDSVEVLETKKLDEKLNIPKKEATGTAKKAQPEKFESHKPKTMDEAMSEIDKEKSLGSANAEPPDQNELPV